MGYNFYESRLDIFDIASQLPYIPWNTSIIFRCTANIDGQPVSKTIPLTIKGTSGLETLKIPRFFKNKTN